MTGAITVNNSFVQGPPIMFRPRFTGNVKAGPRMVVPNYVPMSKGRFFEFLRRARAGERTAYYVGRLASDRETRRGASREYNDAASAVDRLAKAVREAFDDGYVVLCQIPVRLSTGKGGGQRTGDYTYVAVRTDKPLKEN